MTTTPRCPVCQDPLFGRESQRCGACETSHHPECWEYAGGCSTYACAQAMPRDYRRHLHSDGLLLGPDAFLLGLATFCVMATSLFVVVAPWGSAGLVSMLFLLGLPCLTLLFYECCREVHTTLDRQAGTLVRRLTLPFLTLSRWEDDLASLAAARARVQVRLRSRAKIGEVICLELSVVDDGPSQTLAVGRVREWPELRPFARDLAEVLKTDLVVDPALAR